MDKIRKRSGQILPQSKTNDGDVESNDHHSPGGMTSTAIRWRGMSHKSTGTRRSMRLGNFACIFMVVAVVFILYAAACYMILFKDRGEGSTPSKRQALREKNRGHQTFFHDIPESLTISRSRVSPVYLPERPRSIGFYFESAKSDSYLGTERMDPNIIRMYRTYNVIPMDKKAIEAQIDLLDSEDYENRKRDEIEVGGCVAQYDWQLKSFPTCNALHEEALTRLELDPEGNEYVRLIANGYWRDVWKYQSEQDRVVLKTIRYQHDYDDRNYDRHRRDAVAMERLTSSPWIMDIYGFCGNSGLFEFADGGSLDDNIFHKADKEKDWKPEEKLIVAYQVASGLAAMHNYPKEGRAAMAHTDITTSQFVYVGSSGQFKLNDFNRARFIPWDTKKNKTCGYHVGSNPGLFRSPEEYAYKRQTEKVDIYSMGNIFYALLTGLWPYENISRSKKGRELIKKGKTPPIDKAILNTENKFERALLNATKLCWIFEPEARATARQIQTYIGTRLQEFGVQKT